MNLESNSIIVDFILNCLWQAGCLSLMTVIAVLVTRRLQVAMRKLVLGLVLTSWLILPIWNIVAVPLDLNLHQFSLRSTQSAEPEEPSPIAHAGILAAEPVRLGHAAPAVDRVLPESAPSPFPFDAIMWIGGIWLLGIVIGSIKFLIDQHALSRVIRGLRPVEDQSVSELWNAIIMETDRSRRPKLYTTDALETPFSTGWLHPRVVIPESALQEWTDDELSAAMSHELAHWRQRDLISCHLQRVAQIIYWWNPSVSFLNRKLNHLQEVICDTITIHSISNQHDYARLLIKIAENLRGPSAVPNGAVGMARNTSSLEQRIQTITRKETNMKSIEMKPRNVILACSTAAFLALPILGVQLSNADEHQDRHAEAVNKFHFKTASVTRHKKPKHDGSVAEITIKENGVTRMIRVPLNDDTRNASIKDLMKEVEGNQHHVTVRKMEMRKPTKLSAFSDAENIEEQVHREIKKSQEHARLSEAKAETAMKKHMVVLQEKQFKQQAEMQKVMRQKQMKKKIAAMEKRMEALSRENEAIRKELENARNSLDNGSSN